MTVRSSVEAVRSALWLRDCARVGVSVRLRGRPSVNVEGGTITIGDRCTVSSRPVVSHFVAGPDAVLEIGDDVWIGHGAAIAAFERVQIGARTRIGPFAIIMDTNFHGSPGSQSVHHDCRPVVIGRNCTIGSRVTITRGVSIGDDAEILAGSVVSSAIPAGACAGGGRARLVGRAGHLDSRWDSAAAVLPLLLMDALDMASPPELDLAVSDIPGWPLDAVDRLLPRIEQQFGVRLDASDLKNASRVIDIAAAVEYARCERMGPGRI
jgi:acetyltransferase-like isoleucine patch superfamily enzyme